MSSKDTEQLYKKLLEDEEVAGAEPVKALRVEATAAPPSNRKKSCRVPCCCKCLLITVGLFMVLGSVVTAKAYFMVKDAVEHLTVTTPGAKFPVVHMTDRELAVVKDRVALFVDTLTAGQVPAADLVVTQDEINGFIGHSDYLSGNLLVTLSPGKISEQYSLPTEKLPGGKGRYFVGSDYVQIDGDRIEVEMETAAKHEDWFDGPLLFAQLQYLVTKHDDGLSMLEMYLEKGQIFGQEAPQDYIDQHENLLDDLYDDPDCDDARAVINGVEKVSILEGKIVVTPRRDNSAKKNLRKHQP